MRIFTTADELRATVGAELGHSDWLEIDQARIDRFADATGDHQWIHVDAERAATGPFGKTIAHGYLTASLIPVLNKQIYAIESRMGVNYGLNKLRFPSPVPVGSAIRATSTIVGVEEIGDAVQVVTSTTILVRDASKPSVVAEHVARYYW
ncbi:MAG: Enoyl-CoA hydratase [Aeromicrobium sp.]|nr:Enoyl-CoA hydratase [Aeromicrobium sp.]